MAAISTIEQSIDVDVPIARAYNQWTQFEEFPRFMEGVEASTSSTTGTCTGSPSFGGERHEWDAEITEQAPEERVAWRNTDGKDNAGAVTFHKIDDDTTRVMVQMDWAPRASRRRSAQRSARTTVASRATSSASRSSSSPRDGDRRLEGRGSPRGADPRSSTLAARLGENPPRGGGSP